MAPPHPDPDLHLDPEHVRGRAVALAAVVGELGAALTAPPAGDAVADLHAAALRAGRELAEVAAALVRAADAAEAADRAAARRLRW